MAQSVHLLVVRAGGASWGLPMDSVEQTFDLREHRIHQVEHRRVVVFRGDALELHDLADSVRAPEPGDPVAGVVLWAGGRRRVFAVDGMVGQMVLDELDVPDVARGPSCRSVVLLGDEVVPVLEPGVVVGEWGAYSADSFGFSDMQKSALVEIANIGSGHAATALSQLLGKTVDIRYAEALLTTLAEAVDRIGAAASRSAMVDTPVADEGGRVLLVFPDDSGSELCELLGVSLEDEMGRSALREIGNILASSYLNAIVEMTGLPLEPCPPDVDIDVLGTLIERAVTQSAAPSDPTVLMRSVLEIESSEARFAFLFVPQLTSLDGLLDALGVGSVA